MKTFSELPNDLKIEIIFDTVEKPSSGCKKDGTPSKCYTIRFMNCSLFFIHLFDYFFAEKASKAISFLYSINDIKKGVSTLKKDSLNRKMERNLQMRELFHENWGVNEFKNVSEIKWKMFHKILQPAKIPPGFLNHQQAQDNLSTTSEESLETILTDASVSTFVSERAASTDYLFSDEDE